MRPIVIYDFDGTLTRHDSFPAFAIRTAGKARFIKALLKAAPWIVAWKLRLIPGGNAKERLFGFLFKGFTKGEWDEACKAFKAYIESDENPQIMNTLREHRKKGSETVIVTASPADWVRPWAESKGITKVIGTEIEINEEGRLTGKFSGPNCHGPEKVKRFREVYPDISDRDSWAYGDSPSDKYILTLANHQIKV